MNGFVISIGSSIEELSPKATKVATTIGKVNVGGTACKVPLATNYIKKSSIEVALERNVSLHVLNYYM